MELKEEQRQQLKREQNRRYVSFSKRRQGLFSKALQLCMMFDSVQLAIVVLSPASRPYAFGHPSLGTVFNRCFKALPDSVSGVEVEEQTNNQGLKNRLQKKQKRESDDIQEHKKVADVKESIEKELKACKTVQDRVTLRDKYLVIRENINKRLRTVSPGSSEDSMAQYVSKKPMSISGDISANSALNFERNDHPAGDDHYDTKQYVSIESIENMLLGPDENDLCVGGLNGANDVSLVDMVGTSTTAASDTIGSSDMTQHNSTNANGYYNYFENIINSPHNYSQDTSFNFC